METARNSKKPLIALSIIGLLLSLQLGFTTFIDSTYLAGALAKYTNNPDRSVGYIFSLSAAFSLLFFILAPRLLRKIGNTRVTLIAAILLPVALITLALQPNIAIVIVAYLCAALSATTILAACDIFIPAYVSEDDMGFLHGVYFTACSLGFMLSPAAAGYIVATKGLPYAYLAATLCTLPIALIVWSTFKNFSDDDYEDVPAFPTKKLRSTAPDLMPVFWAHFALQSFYAIMTIYVPLFFVEEVGLGLDQIGIILTIALSTFVLLPTPLGWIADKYLGEKEMIIIGIILMGGSLATLPILARHPQSLLTWGILLFISRIGATMAESMTDTFFFKKIEHAHPSLVAFYRRARPLALLTVPAVCAILLSLRIVDMSELFLFMGALIVVSIIVPFKLVDTK